MNKSEVHSPKDALCQVETARPSSSGEDPLTLSIYFHYHLPLQKGMSLHLNKFEYAIPKNP